MTFLEKNSFLWTHALFLPSFTLDFSKNKDSMYSILWFIKGILVWNFSWIEWQPMICSKRKKNYFSGLLLYITWIHRLSIKSTNSKYIQQVNGRSSTERCMYVRSITDPPCLFVWCICPLKEVNSPLNRSLNERGKYYGHVQKRFPHEWAVLSPFFHNSGHDLGSCARLI